MLESDKSYKSSHKERFYKKVILKNFAKFKEKKTLVLVPFLVKVSTWRLEDCNVITVNVHSIRGIFLGVLRNFLRTSI